MIMLRELRVKDFAIIEELSIQFEPGLNVLTGETGAGKSIIIDALGVALGGRAYTEMIKTGAESASIEALFDFEKKTFPLFEGLGITGGEEIILRRIISASGKSRAYLNGSLVNTQNLLETGKGLVDIHGQHEHQSLLSSQNQLALLDEFAGTQPERENFTALFSEISSLRNRLKEIEASKRERAQKLDLLGFQAEEISSAGLEPGEDEKLEEERKILSNLSKLRELIENCYMLLYDGEHASLSSLKKTRLALSEMAGIDQSAKEPLSLLESAIPLLEEASMLIRGSRDRYDLDPKRLDEVTERLELISKLKKKYGASIEEIREYGEKARAELKDLSELEDNGLRLESLLTEKETALKEAGHALSGKRKAGAIKAEKAVLSILKELALEKADFKIEVRETEPCPEGADRVEFLFTANPGEALKPLQKVASGGELSRIMLAIKSALRGDKNNYIPVLIFDEVDAGIGGATAGNVAMKLKGLAGTGHQVLCVTHLPQIASCADAHFHVEKDMKKGKTSVTIKRLSGKEREEEVARMLGGKVTGISIRHAKELLDRK